MIVKVKKWIFLGIKRDLDTFFKRAQKKGCIEFSSRELQPSELSPSIQNLISACKILRKQPHIEAKEPTLDPDQLAREISTQQSLLTEKVEERRRLRKEIERVAPLGDFSTEGIREIERWSGRRIRFLYAKKGDNRLPPDTIPLEIGGDKEYFMQFDKGEGAAPDMHEIRIEKSVREVEAELRDTEKAIDRIRSTLEKAAAYLPTLQRHLSSAIDAHNLKKAKNRASNRMDDTLFAVEGWLPENRERELASLLQALSIHAEEVAIDREERTPTHMENRGFGRVGEDLVRIYETPSTEDRDPSTWVFWAFSLFFAMIISDAGYGSIYLLIAIFLKKKFSQTTAAVKRFLRLFTAISLFCIVWGVLENSYFGIDLPPDHPLQKLSIVHLLTVKKAHYHIAYRDAVYEEWTTKFPRLKEVQDGETFLKEGVQRKDGIERYVVLSDFRDSISMEIALFIGVLHICLSLLRQAMRKQFAGVGWVVAIIGSYLYFPHILGTTSILHFTHIIAKQTAREVGLQLLPGGAICAILASIIQNRWRGLVELTKPIELFSDILSYLRLYALGLAGMILGATFNELGANLGPIAGISIAVCGHGINLVIGAMGGTIHGLRLNFIEWYHHSFTGGGKLFQPLQCIE